MRIQCTLISLLLASSAVEAHSSFNLTPGVTPLSHDIFFLHMTVFWVCVVIGIAVFGAMFYALLNHRRSLGVTAATFHEHTWIEITWTIVPLLILILLAIPATKVLMTMNNTDAEDITIKITGYQWKWHYDYLNQDIHFFSNMNTPLDQIQGRAPKGENYLRSVDHPLVLPIHKKIRFLVTANDVIHSWWVPALGVKRDAIPGFINEAWARINKPGVYFGNCTELCGINHAYMTIVVIAMGEQDFANWLAEQKGQLKPPTTPAAVAPTATPTKAVAGQPVAASNKPSVEDLMKNGEKIYLGTCAVCHQPTGLGLPPTFPALKGSPITTGPVDVHIERVLEGKPGTAMQAFKDQLSEEDIAAVITYERNSWGNNKGSAPQAILPEIIKAAKEKHR